MSKEGRGKGKEYEGNLSFGWREMGYTKENWRDLFSSRSTIFIPTKLREEKKKRESFEGRTLISVLSPFLSSIQTKQLERKNTLPSLCFPPTSTLLPLAFLPSILPNLG
jgi:hypothetical protein